MLRLPSNPEETTQVANLQALLAASDLPPLPDSIAIRFAAYLSLFVRWNTRTNLSAIRDEDGIIRRHLIESIEVAFEIPKGVATLVDYGSGGGLPGIPIALCRPEIHVTLAESQNKKAAFLREAVRVLGLNTTIHAARAETLPSLYDCVILRAVDKMDVAVKSAAGLVRPAGYLALMTTHDRLPALQNAVGQAFTWRPSQPLRGTREAVLALAQSHPGS